MLSAALSLAVLCACGISPAAGEGLLCRAAGVRADETFLTADGQAVCAERYLYFLAEACDRITDCYQDEGLEPDWSAQMGQQTLAQYAAEQAVRTAALYAQVEAWGSRYDCSISEDERAAAQALWQPDDAGDGAQRAQRLAYMGVDEAFAQALSEDYYLYARLYRLSRTEGSELNPGAAALETWGQSRGMCTVRTLCLPAPDGEDAAARETRRATAENLSKQLQLHEDPEEAFSALGKQAGAAEEMKTFVPGSSGLPAEVEAAALTLSEGALSPVIETESGCWLVLRGPLDQEAAAAAWFDDRLQAAADTAQIQRSAALEKLNTREFYETLCTLRARTEPADHAADSGAGSGEASGSAEVSASDGADSPAQGTVINLPDGNQQNA